MIVPLNSKRLLGDSNKECSHEKFSEYKDTMRTTMGGHLFKDIDWRTLF